MCVCVHFVCMYVCLQLPSNQSFYREITDYRMSISDHKIKQDHGQTNQLHNINWGARDHASCAPQLMLCNYYLCVCVSVSMCVCVFVECVQVIMALRRDTPKPGPWTLDWTME